MAGGTWSEGKVRLRGGWEPRRRMREAVVMREMPVLEEKVEWVKAQYSEWPARRQMGPRDQGEGEVLGLGGDSCSDGGGEGGCCDWDETVGDACFVG
jgi:hypothetical protein